MRLALLLSFVTMNTLAAGDEFNRLYVASGEAKSFLQSNWNKYQENYHPNYAFDDNEATAWVEGSEGYGEGEELSWEVSELQTADEAKLRIRNGYQKSKSLFAANSSVQEAEVTLVGKKVNFVTTQKIKLENKMGWQEFIFKLPENHGLSKISFKILSTYPGKTYKDTCISDIEVLVKSKVPYEPKTEEAKKIALATWIKERVVAAKFFASKPATYPFVSSTFRESDHKFYYPTEMKEYISGGKTDIFYEGKEPKNFGKAMELAEARALISKYNIKSENNKKWFKVVRSKNSGFMPDGLYSLGTFGNSLMSYLNLDNVSSFETKDKIASVEKATEYDYTRTTTNHAIYEEGTNKVLVYWTNAKGMERGPFDIDSTYILSYKKGLLEWALEVSTESTYLKMLYDNSGKISEVLKIGVGTGEYEEPPFSYYVYKAQASTPKVSSKE